MAFHKKNKPILVLLLILFGFSSLPANDFGQKIYPVDGDVWERIEILYLEQGLAPPSNSGPWSKEELVKMVDRINPGELSKAGEAVYDLLTEELYSQPKLSSDGGFGITAGLNVAVEGYYHTNGEDFNDDTDWTYGFEEREKLISGEVEIWLGENIYSYWEPFIGTTRYGEEDDVESAAAIYGQELYNNIVLLDASNLDLTFPYRAFAAVGGDYWSLAFGRDVLSWGAGHTGNMVLGDHHDYYESIRFTAFFEYFKYTYVFAGFDHPDWDGSQNDEPTGLQMFVGHRMETRFWDKLKFTLDEEAMLNLSSVDEDGNAEDYAGFDFRYLNPMMIYHNTYNRGIANSILSLEVEYTPWKYFSIYGQYAIDEFQTAEEKENHPDSNPGAVGIIAGIEGVYPLGPGYLTSYFEFAKTDPYMYLRDNVDYIVYRRQFNIDTNVEQDVKFLGYEEGPDAMVFELNICYKVRDVWEAGLTGSYLLHGENDAETEWSTGEESNSKVTPSGDYVEKTFTLTLTGEYNIPLFKDQQVSIYGEADYITSENFKNEDGNNTNDIQLVLGVKYSL